MDLRWHTRKVLAGIPKYLTVFNQKCKESIRVVKRAHLNELSHFQTNREMMKAALPAWIVARAVQVESTQFKRSGLAPGLMKVGQGYIFIEPLKYSEVLYEFDMFNEFRSDTLTLRKPNGQVFENITACVTGKGILIEDVRLPIEAGDKLTRSLPSGLTEEFVVDDPGFHQAFGDIDAHFQVKVRRAGSEGKPPEVQNVFYGPVGSLAQNSQHFSQTASIGVQSQDLARLVTELATHLDELNLEPRQKQRAEAQIATLRVELAGEADPAIVKQAGHTLRSIIEGAIGSLLATAAQPGLWHWIHQTLAGF